MLNADHATHNPFAAESRAFGWPKRLFHTPEGLFCDVELTNLGVEAIEQKHYRYTSAEIAPKYRTSTGDVYSDLFCGLALTNTPYHDTMPGVFAAGDKASFWVLTSGATRQELDPELQATFAKQLQRGKTGPLLFALADGVMSHRDVEEAVYQALVAESGGDDTDWDEWPHIEDCYPEFVIYSRGWGAPWFKRGYTIVDRTAVLAAEIVEVQWVWVEKARQAFAAAQRDVRKLGAVASPVPATRTGAKGESMSQAQGSKKTFGQMLRDFFGVAQDATPEQFTQALDAAPAPAAEPAADPGKTVTTSQPTPAEVVELRQRLDAQEEEMKELRRKSAEADEALNLQQAEELIAKYEREGKITPAQRDLKDAEGKGVLLQSALRDPVAFATIYDAAKPQIDLTQRGGLNPRQGSGGDEPAESYSSKVADLVRGGMAFDKAARQVAGDFPALYERHKAGGR
jgi:phage I-like protein